MPVIHCPHCGTPVDIHPDDAGYKVLCPNCHNAFQAGDGERAMPEPLVSPPVPTGSSGTREREESWAVLSRCTECRGSVEIGVEDLGHLMECPLCGEKFRAERETPARGDSHRNWDDRPSRRSRDREEDEEDDDDYDDRPRRRRYRDEDKPYILDTARAAITWPANGLMWTGTIMFVLYLLSATGLTIAGIIKQDSPNAADRTDGVMFLVFATIIMVFGGTHGAIMAVAGFQMKKLRSAGWGYAGGGLGIATFVLSHPCLPTTWAAVTFGIWAIIAYSKREVQDAIRINTAGRE